MAAIGELTRSAFTDNKLLYEDAAPFLYMQDLIEGRKKNTKIKHLFIDEAQDYSPFQMAYMRSIFPAASMTVLGDINQSIYAHTIHGDQRMDACFEDDPAEYVRLKRTYRSTRQIVEFTKAMLQDGADIEPFNRSGKCRSLSKLKDMRAFAKSSRKKLAGSRKRARNNSRHLQDCAAMHTGARPHE